MSRVTWLVCSTVLIANFVSTVSAENDESDRAVAIFLKEHVNGKTLVGPETIDRIDNGKVESVISARFKYRNFTETKFGFYFDEESTFVQTLYDLDAEGKRVGQGLKKDRSFIKRYQVGQRRSTKELIGITFVVNDKGQVVAENDGDYPFSPCSVYMQMKNGNLVVNVTTVLYQDLFAKGGKWRPGIEEDVSVFSVQEGKLLRVLKTKGYDVDPRTLEKKLSDDLPEETHKEVGG